MRKPLYFHLLFLSLLSANVVFGQTSATSAYEGFGAITHGGDGRPIIHVTNLNATGPGSLYAAIGSNRTIVFDIAGTINNFRWDSSNEFPVTNLTIDGRSAPSPGITLNNNYNGHALSFQYGCHDIIVTGIRVRNAGLDGINVVGGYNMVFDHVSVSGSGDGNFDITNGAYNITVQYSIIGGGRSKWSGAMLIAYHPTRNISIHHNLFNSRGTAYETGERRGSIGERNPLVHSANNLVTENLMADIRNNIIWNWGNTSATPCCGYGFGTGLDYGATANIINNFYQTAGNQEDNAIDFNHNDGIARGYVSGNISGNKGIRLDSLGNMSAPWPAATVVTQDACVAAMKVLAEAGLRPLDSIDQLLINAVSLANCQAAHNQIRRGDIEYEIASIAPSKPFQLPLNSIGDRMIHIYARNINEWKTFTGRSRRQRI